MVSVEKEAGWNPEEVWALWSREEFILPVAGIQPVRPVNSPSLFCVDGDEHFDSMDIDFDNFVD